MRGGWAKVNDEAGVVLDGEWAWETLGEYSKKRVLWVRATPSRKTSFPVFSHFSSATGLDENTLVGDVLSYTQDVRIGGIGSNTVTTLTICINED